MTDIFDMKIMSSLLLVFPFQHMQRKEYIYVKVLKSGDPLVRSLHIFLVKDRIKTLKTPSGEHGAGQGNM